MNEKDSRSYGQLAGNRSINETIYYCFQLIEVEDQQRFARAFQAPATDDRRMHTFRELILGAYLSQNRQRVRYAQDIAGKTPDWAVVGDDDHVRCVVELVNYHIDRSTEDAIRRHLDAGECYAYYPSSPNNDKRLWDKIDGKAATYRDLVNKMLLPYVVAVHTAFEADVESSDIRRALTGGEAPLFSEAPHVSGLLHFAECGGAYHFVYYENPNAARPFAIPSGRLTNRPGSRG